jgi:membrane protein implicated in regulation of membrane protease activity
MPSDLAILFAFTGASLIATAVGFAVAWRRAARRARREESRLLASTPEMGRIARLEQAVEGMALDVERIAEGQRFTARLLAEVHERVARPQLPDQPVASPRVITPH